MTFFEERQLPAILKHNLLKQYLPRFAGMLGSTARDQRVVYLDGYAGAGAYEEGSFGSPLYAAEIAREMLGRSDRAKREVACYFIECDRTTFEDLEKTLEPYPGWTALFGKVSERLDEVLEEAEGSPLLAFLDPFGLGDLPMARIAEIMGRGGTTEVLLTFVRSGLFRSAGGILSSESTNATFLKARDTRLKTVDDLMGGSWWRNVWLEAIEANTPAVDRDEAFAKEYARRLCDMAKGSWGSAVIPVARNPSGKPIYYLIYFSSSPYGFWEFAGSLSMAHKEYNEKAASNASELHLDYSEAWVDEIEENVAALLAGGDTVVPMRRMVDVFGSSIGYAREMHLRKALKRLYESGALATEPKGSLRKLRLEPGPNA